MQAVKKRRSPQIPQWNPNLVHCTTLIVFLCSTVKLDRRSWQILQVWKEAFDDIQDTNVSHSLWPTLDFCIKASIVSPLFSKSSMDFSTTSFTCTRFWKHRKYVRVFEMLQGNQTRVFKQHWEIAEKKASKRIHRLRPIFMTGLVKILLNLRQLIGLWRILETLQKGVTLRKL